ncbi:winged helix-turn-helix transcriptional regulator [Fusibacter sp. 3D3]|uniref:winged helix-turn-helix transcriptional regulator n=1 Tax=Fusibacter sp. 3D3 TaxID=1048380 RepID=UPI000852BC48|nr:winged helix-turn-helix transcriptional regulator [Fusibacter sp. 3D3]GAU76258.1 hypothetical protein F3D3_0855 [Fusibacter sp. 3D3]
MREICKMIGLKEPEIEEKGLFVVLRIYRKVTSASSLFSENSVVAKTKSEVIRDEKDKIFELLIGDKQVTVKDIANKIGITEASVQRRLKSMQEDGLIKRIGSKKSGYWDVKL